MGRQLKYVLLTCIYDTIFIFIVEYQEFHRLGTDNNHIGYQQSHVGKRIFPTEKVGKWVKQMSLDMTIESIKLDKF